MIDLEGTAAKHFFMSTPNNQEDLRQLMGQMEKHVTHHLKPSWNATTVFREENNTLWSKTKEKIPHLTVLTNLIHNEMKTAHLNL